MSRGSSDGGRTKATDEEILAVVRSATDPVLSTAEIAERLPIARRSTLDRLRTLEDRGLLESKSIGGRNTVWWLPERGEDANRGSDDDDPFFSDGPLFASDEPVAEDEIDDVVYGSAEG